MNSYKKGKEFGRFERQLGVQVGKSGVEVGCAYIQWFTVFGHWYIFH